MTTEQGGGPRLVRDDDLTRELRSIYAAPTDVAYWGALERKIFARIADDGDSVPADLWWSVPERWLRIGLIAAGFALIVAGSLLLRTQAQVSRMAYDTVVEPAIDAPTLAAREKLTEEQATLRALTGR
jgi:hypothetical protein